MEQRDNILWLLKQAWYFSLTQVNDAVSEHGVSTAQIGMLRQLATEPGLSGADLARRLLISPQGVQLALKELERRGLVERSRSPSDRRGVIVRLTPDGARTVDAAMADLLDRERALLAELDGGDRDHLAATLRQLLSPFEA